MKTKIYLNLTNGLEALKFFPEASFIRIQSSHVEGKAYEAIMSQLSDDFLMNLALGNNCVIIDGSVHPKGSKAIRNGLEMVLSILNHYWFDTDYKDEFTNKVLESLRESTRNKIKYYSKFLLTKQLNVLPLSFRTNKDGDYEYYKRLCASHFGNLVNFLENRL